MQGSVERRDSGDRGPTFSELASACADVASWQVGGKALLSRQKVRVDFRGWSPVVLDVLFPWYLGPSGFLVFSGLHINRAEWGRIVT